MKTQTLSAISATQKKSKRASSLRRLEADRLLQVWRKKNTAKLKGWDAVKAVRALRDGKLR